MILTIEDSYRDTIERLTQLLDDDKITYDLLWALFRANDHVITTCPGSGKPRCLRYDLGEEKKTDQGLEYFELQCRYFDFDGKVFGEVTEMLSIPKFRGSRPITALEHFPLRFHPALDDIRDQLTACGRKFVEMMGRQHRYYDGQAFFQSSSGPIRIPVKSRIMVDPELFRKTNPNYPRLFTKKSDGNIFCGKSLSERVKSNGLNPDDLEGDDWLILSPTVLGFSLDNKFWGEYL